MSFKRASVNNGHQDSGPSKRANTSHSEGFSGQSNPGRPPKADQNVQSASKKFINFQKSGEQTSKASSNRR